MLLIASFLQLVNPLRAAMTRPSFASFLGLLSGWVLCARHTVTEMIRAAALVGRKHHSSFHRLFSAARWSVDELGLGVFQLLLPLLPATLVLSLDDTLCPKRGLHLYGAGMHHDPLQSSRKQAQTRWGHSFVVLAVVVRLRCCPQRVFSLPILGRLYLNHKAAARWGARYHSRPELAVQMLHLLCARFPTLRFHVVADSAYGGQSVLGQLPPRMRAEAWGSCTEGELLHYQRRPRHEAHGIYRLLGPLDLGEALAVADPSGVLVLRKSDGQPLLDHAAPAGVHQLFFDDGRFTLGGLDSCGGGAHGARVFARCGQMLVYFNGSRAALIDARRLRVTAEGRYKLRPRAPGNGRASESEAVIPLGPYRLMLRGVIHMH